LNSDHKKYNDLGLGVKASAGRYRILNKDGSFNVQMTNLPFKERVNFFHYLVSVSWPRFFGLLLLSYFVINILFALFYFLVGVEYLTGIEGSHEFEHFLGAFFFSAQTLTTLGYGRVAPIGLITNSIAATESMIGLLLFALATGMLYCRFSKPTAKIKYSSNAVIAPYQNINGFMFRLLNPHKNQLLEVEANISLSWLKDNSEMRDFFQLDLERNSVIFLTSAWTVVHPITQESPMCGVTDDILRKKDAEFIITIKAFDESSAQLVYSRTSYKANEVRWGEKFAYIIDHSAVGLSIDASRLGESYQADLNLSPPA